MHPISYDDRLTNRLIDIFASGRKPWQQVCVFWDSVDSVDASGGGWVVGLWCYRSLQKIAFLLVCTHFLGMTKSILTRLWSKKVWVSLIDDSKHSKEKTYPCQWLSMCKWSWWHDVTKGPVPSSSPAGSHFIILVSRRLESWPDGLFCNIGNEHLGYYAWRWEHTGVQISKNRRAIRRLMRENKIVVLWRRFPVQDIFVCWYDMVVVDWNTCLRAILLVLSVNIFFVAHVPTV